MLPLRRVNVRLTCASGFTPAARNSSAQYRRERNPRLSSRRCRWTSRTPAIGVRTNSNRPNACVRPGEHVLADLRVRQFAHVRTTTPRLMPRQCLVERGLEAPSRAPSEAVARLAGVEREMFGLVGLSCLAAIP